MDVISFSEAATANSRIEIINANPDSNSGVLTQPKVIEAGETVTIKSGRQAILADTVVDGDLVIEAGGEVFVPAGANFSDLNGQIALKADTSYVNGKYSGFKNYIINGDMRIAQRGIGPFTANGYGIDQWFSFISSGASNVTRIWNGTGSHHISYAEVTVGSGADIVTMEQRLETPHRFSGKTLTLSYTLFNGNYSGSGVNYNISLNHAGGRTVLFSGASVFTGEAKKKVTFTVPDLYGYTLNTNSYLEIRPVEIIGNGYSGVFGITDIQLEEGSVATPFENRPYGLELSLCQRYYEVGRCIQQLGIGTTIGVILTGQVFFKTSKRIVPTVTYLDFSGAQNKVTLLNNSGTETNGVSITAGNQTNNDMRLTASTTNTTQNGISFTYTASAEL